MKEVSPLTVLVVAAVSVAVAAGALVVALLAAGGHGLTIPIVLILLTTGCGVASRTLLRSTVRRFKTASDSAHPQTPRRAQQPLKQAPPRPTEHEEDMQPRQAAELKAVTVLEDFLNERWDELRAAFDEQMRAECPAELLAASNALVRSEVGRLRHLGTPSPSVRNGQIVVDVPMAFRHGDRLGRVVFDADGRVCGFFVRPAALAWCPFPRSRRRKLRVLGAARRSGPRAR